MDVRCVTTVASVLYDTSLICWTNLSYQSYRIVSYRSSIESLLNIRATQRMLVSSVLFRRCVRDDFSHLLPLLTFHLRRSHTWNSCGVRSSVKTPAVSTPVVLVVGSPPRIGSWVGKDARRLATSQDENINSEVHVNLFPFQYNLWWPCDLYV